MFPIIRNYLEQIRLHLRLEPVLERQVISELDTYFEEKIAELGAKGLSEEEATKVAMRSFGRPRILARMLYEACSKGSWTDAAISSSPHFIVAGLFASGLWHNIIVAPIVFIFILCVTLFGWWHGKPNWLYSWIGYSLIPLIIGGYASRSTVGQTVSFFLGRNETFPNVSKFLLISALFVFFSWVMVGTTIRVVKRDWVLASLMLAPLPILAAWFFNIEQMGGLFQSNDVLHQWNSPMALAFATLGLNSITFIRLRKRLLKVSAVLVIGSTALTMVVHNIWGRLSFFGLLALFVLMTVFLLTPILMEKYVGHGEVKPTTWWATYYKEHSI